MRQGKVSALLIATLMLFSATTARAESPPRGPVSVGVITHLSGPLEEVGTFVREGVELAAADLGAAQVKVTFEDDGFSPQRAVSAFHSLIARKDIDAIICTSSSPCTALAPLAEERGIPLVAWASDARVSKGRTMTARSYPPGAREGAIVAARERARGARRAAALISQNAYSQSWLDGVREIFPAEELIIDEEVTGGESSVRPLATKVLAQKIDSVGLCLDPGLNASLARRLREHHYTGGLFGCMYLATDEELKAASGALDDAWVPVARASDQFAARVHATPSSTKAIVAANSYIALQLLQKALQGGAPREEYRARLLALPPLDTVIGRVRIVDDEGDAYTDFPLTAQRAGASG